MVATYSVFGRQVGSHVLAMITLGTTFTVAGVSLAGGDKASKAAGPPIQAQSSDEEKFIREFIQNAEAEEKKAKH